MTKSTRPLLLLSGLLILASAAQGQLTNQSLSPSSGSSAAGAAQTFTAVYVDGAGTGELAYAYFIVGASGAGTSNTCYMYWSGPGSAFYMLNDAVSGWLGPLYPGSGGTIQNSQCTVYGTGSSVNFSGNQIIMTVKMSFSAAYAGTKNLYMTASGTQGDYSPLQQMGTWTIGGSGSAPDLTISNSSAASFPAGGSGSYTLTVSNVGNAATSGTVTVTDTLPGGLSFSAMSGSGWTCTPPSCSRSDSLTTSASYPAITVAVNVSSSASGTVTDTANVSGGGETNTSNDSASASTTITGGGGGGGGGNTLAAMTSPSPGSALGGSTVMFNWNTGAGVSAYWLYVGSTVGGYDIYTANEGTSLSQQVTGLPVNGSTVYVRLWSDFSTGWQSVDYAYTAYGGSGTAAWTIAKSHTGSFTQGQTGTYTITASNSGTAATTGTVTLTDTLPGGLTVNSMSGSGWSCTPPSCSRSDSLAAGNSYPAITLTVNVTGSPGSVTNTATVSGGGANSSTANDGTTIIGGCGTLATMVSPTSGGTLSGSTATFTWNPSCTATQYYLYLGNTQGSNNLYGQSQGTNLSSGPVSIPSSGTLWVRLWSLLPAGWQFNDYSYTIGGGGGGGCGSTATMTSPPTNGSTLTSSSFTFTWCNAGAAQYYLYAGTVGVGSNNIFSNSTGTNLSQLVTALPSSGTLYVRLWSSAGGSWLYNDYTYTMSTTSTVSITVTSSPAGLSLTVDGAACTAPCTNQWTSGTSHTIYAATQSGGSGTQYVFANWSDGGAASHQVAPTSAFTYTASFTTQYYLTTTAAAGGTIVPATGWQNAGSVTVTATPNTGYQFTGFTGTINSTANPLTFTITGPTSETANFTPSSFTIAILNGGQTVTSSAPAALTIPGANGSVTYPLMVQATAVGNYNGTINFGPYSNFPSGVVPTTGASSITLNGSGSAMGSFPLTVYWSAQAGGYTAWFSAYDGKGLAQTVYVYLSLTTGPPPALSTTCLASPNPATVSQPVNFIAFPTGGRPPYSYFWSQAVSGTGTGAPFSSSTPGTYNAHISVTDSSSPTHQTAASDCSVSVNNWSPASIVSPTPGAILTGGTATTFSWNAGTGVSQYQLTLGSTPGAADFGSINTGSVQSATIQLPSGNPPVTVWATVGSLFGTTWWYRYYNYQVAANPSSPGPNGIMVLPPATGSASAHFVSNSYYVYTDGKEQTWDYVLRFGSSSGITCQMDDSLLFIDNTQAPDPNQPVNVFSLTFRASPGVKTGAHTLTCNWQGYILSLPNALTVYDGTPVITDVEPAALPGTPPAVVLQGGQVTIIGNNFGEAGTLQLCNLNLLGCNTIPSTTWSPNQITATISQSPGQYEVQVVSAGSLGTTFFPASTTSASSNFWEVDVAAVTVTIDSLQVAQPATPDAASGQAPSATTVTVTDTSSAFAVDASPACVAGPPVAACLLTVLKDSGTVTVTAMNVQPGSSTNQIRWQLDRDTSDTVDSAVPALGTTSASQVTFQPSAAGNFRLLAYVDANGNGTFDEGEQLRVLRIAIVRATIQTSSLFVTRNNVLVAQGGSSVITGADGTVRTAAMVLGAVYLLEGGGAMRTIGTAAITIGDVGNLLSDTFTVTYPVPVPTPPAPGNVAGTGTEVPGGPTPMLDTKNVTSANQNTGGAIPFRESQVAAGGLPLPPSTGGKIVGIVSADAPKFTWNLFHPTTGNNWGSTTGSNAFLETIAAFSSSFPQTYAALNQAAWTVTPSGSFNSQWQCANCSVTGDSAFRSVTNQVQVRGPSFATSNTKTYQ